MEVKYFNICNLIWLTGTEKNKNFFINSYCVQCSCDQIIEKGCFLLGVRAIPCFTDLKIGYSKLDLKKAVDSKIQL